MTTIALRWGIVGTGAIAGRFAEGLASVPGARLVAVASRTPEGAARFGATHAVPARYVGAAALAADPDVDAVYIATPHPRHHPDTLACLAGGKAVLCEKPFAMNAAETRAMIVAARARGVFLMEAMWTHCFPAMARVRELLAAGAIGAVRQVHASFGFRTAWNPQSRLLDPALGGGALLDVGIYPVALARMVFGRAPARVTGLAHLGETGVDEQSAMLLAYPDGALAVLSCAVRTATRHDAVIYGTDGHIVIPRFWQPERLLVKRGAAPEQEMVFPPDGNGYRHEAAHVADCLGAGLLESPILPLSATLDNLLTLDQLRADWGLRYPMEASPRTESAQQPRPAGPRR